MEKKFLVCFLIRHSQRSRIRVLASSSNSWVPSWVCVMTSLISFLFFNVFVFYWLDALFGVVVPLQIVLLPLF